MANKKTQREYFNEIITLAKANNRDDIVKFAEGRIEVLNNKTANRTQTATQKENEIIKENILNTLMTIKSGTVTDIQQANKDLGKYSNQKISALLRQLKEAGKIVKDTDKKNRTIFSLVEGE